MKISIRARNRKPTEKKAKYKFSSGGKTIEGKIWKKSYYLVTMKEVKIQTEIFSLTLTGPRRG